MNKKDKLFKILKHIGKTSVWNNNLWGIVRDIQKDIKPTDILKLEDLRSFKINDLDLTKLETWSTYNNSYCIHIEICVKNEELLTRITINEGDMFNGNFKERKFIATIKLNKDKILLFEYNINNRINCQLEEEWEDFLEKQKEDFIDNMREKIYNSLGINE